MSIPEPVRRSFGPSVRPLGGGYSGETFRADVDGADVVLRIYGRSLERAAVDVGLLRRLRVVVPVPAVLDARVEPTGALPAYVMTSLLPGERLDLVLAEAGEQTAYELGRAVAGVLLRLATVRFDRPGMLSGADLAVVPMPEELQTLESWVGRHLARPWFAGWAPEDRAALLSLARGVRPLLDAVGAEATLVHADLNPKNLLVDTERSEVTGLLDWEFAYAGSRLADLGNLLRFPSMTRSRSRLRSWPESSSSRRPAGCRRAGWTPRGHWTCSRWSSLLAGNGSIRSSSERVSCC